MSGNNSKQIRCPRCKKLGTLRLRQPKKNTVITYHYNKQKYKNGGSGTSSCYIGSLSKSAESILLKYSKEVFDKNSSLEIEEEKFKDTYKKLKKKFENHSSKSVLLNAELTKFAQILDEIRRIRITLHMEHNTKKITKEWGIECPECKTRIEMRATFNGVTQSGDFLFDRPRTKLYYHKVV